MIARALAAAAVAVGAIALGDAARRAWSDTRGDLARDVAVGVVWGLAGLLTVSAALGLVGLFGGTALVVATVGAGLVAQVLARRSPSVPAGDRASRTASLPSAGPEPRWLSLAAIGAVGAVALLWASASVETLRFGMSDVDAQHYHLPHALRFAQTGRVFDVHHVSAGDLAAYHPNNDELLRAVGIATGGSILPGLVVNWLAAMLVLLASVLAGRRVGRPASSVLLAAAVLAAPLVGPVYGGRAFNDHLALGLLAIAAALALEDVRSPGRLATVGAALGLAVGTKLTVLAPAAVLTVALLVTSPRGTRARRWSAVLAPLVGLGSWWYVRNLLVAGNPAPGVGVPGLPQPSTPFIDEIGASVLSYAGDLDVVTSWFVPGFRDALGWLWPLHLLVVVAGVVLGLVVLARRSGANRAWTGVLALMALATVVAWLTISTGAAGGPGEPALFRFNVRYLFPAVLFAGWVALGRLPVRWAGGVGLALVVGTMVPAVQRAPVPRLGPPDAGLATVLVLAVGLACAGVWQLVGRRWDARLLVRLVASLLVVAVAVLAGPARDPHLASRYARGPSRTVLFSAVEDTSGLRVGVVGLPLHYGFVGRDHGNRVDYLGRPTGDGGFVNIDDCEVLMAEIDAGGYDLVATLHFSATPAPVAADWFEASPAFKVEASAPEGRLWRVVAEPDGRRCPSTPASSADA